MQYPEIFSRFNLDEDYLANPRSRVTRLFLQDQVDAYNGFLLPLWREIGHQLEDENMDKSDESIDTATKRFIISIRSSSNTHHKVWTREPRFQGRHLVNNEIETEIAKLFFWPLHDTQTFQMMKLLMSGKYDQPNQAFDEAFVEAFPVTEGREVLERLLSVTRFIQGNSVSLSRANKLRGYFLHIRHTSANPMGQYLTVMRDVKKMFTKRRFLKGWRIMGFSHLLGDWSEIFLKKLSEVLLVPSDQIQFNGPLQPENLMSEPWPELISYTNFTPFGIIFNALQFSPRLSAEYTVKGTLPTFGYLEFPVSALSEFRRVQEKKAQGESNSD